MTRPAPVTAREALDALRQQYAPDELDMYKREFRAAAGADALDLAAHVVAAFAPVLALDEDAALLLMRAHRLSAPFAQLCTADKALAVWHVCCRRGEDDPPFQTPGGHLMADDDKRAYRAALVRGIERRLARVRDATTRGDDASAADEMADLLRASLLTDAAVPDRHDNLLPSLGSFVRSQWDAADRYQLVSAEVRRELSRVAAAAVAARAPIGVMDEILRRSMM